MKYTLLLAAVSAVKINEDGLNQAKMEQFIQVDLEERSDPICSSAGCDQYKHPEAPEEPPRDYFVPNFGPLDDMVDTLNNEAAASAALKHKW
jgi:hypothetical protein